MTRSIQAACALATLVAAHAARAQRPDTARSDAAPAEYVRSTLETYNAPGTRRYTRRGEIPAGERVPEDVAVYGATLVVGGEVGGRLVAINGDIILRPGSRVAGDVLVIGGTVTGADSALVNGGVQAWPEIVLVRESQGGLALASDTADVGWVERLIGRGRRSGQRIGLGKVGVYNRVEGLPIGLGPVARTELPWGAIWIRALGIYRLNEDIDFDAPNVGHDVSAHVRLGTRRGVAVGGHLYDVVEAVEPWHLDDIEVSLATFFLHRDYRDYFGRHGGAAEVSFFSGGEETEVTLSYSDERWLSLGQRDPFTLLRGSQPWRPNPAADVGRVHLTQLRVRHDTRNDADDPWSGWLLMAELEHGRVRYDAPVVTDALVRPPVAAGTKQTYRRLLVDVRRYNRIAPGAQVNLRLVAGGWLGGGELPMQRRFSVGGPGTLPGFDFRRVEGSPETGTCAPAGSAVPGAPAMCERVLLAQAEYRRELRAGLFDWLGAGRASLGALAAHGDWLVFADVGRGWLVGQRFADLVYPQRDIPGLGTFRADVGAGVDFGALGFYVAKAISKGAEPPNFIFRARHRF
jgi:hypothetical protein